LVVGFGEGEESGWDDGGEVVLAAVLIAGVENVFDFFFEGDEPGGDVEADAGGLAGEILGIVLEHLELGGLAAFAGFVDGGGDEGPDAVNREWANEPFGQTIGDGWHPHGVFFL
jgi:hypothetical protein